MSRLKLVAGAASSDETVYSEAFEQLDAGLCIIDGDGAVLANNRAFCRLLDLPFDWGSPKAAERAIPASEELVTGWLARIASEGGLAETVALSDHLTLRVVGKALPSGGASLTLTEAADADRRALAESEARFRALLAHLPSMISLKDAEGKFLIVNTAWERDLQISAEDILGRTVWDAFPSQDWSKSDTSDAQLLAGERDVIEDEIAVDIAEHDRRIFHQTKFPVLDGDGRPVGVGTINTDVTEQVHARDVLRRSEAGLRQAQRLAKTGHWERNFATSEDFWTDTMFEFFGFEKGPVPDVQTILERIHPEDRDIMRDSLAAIYAGNAYREAEFRVVLPSSGEVRHLCDVLEADFDNDGHPVRIFGIVQDVTEARLAEQALRESEQRYRSLVDNLPNAVSVKNREHRFISVNKTFENWFDCTQESVSGKTADLVLPKNNHWGPMTAAEEDVLNGRRKNFEIVVTPDFEEGAPRTFELRKFPVTDDDGRITAVGTISTDITERLRAEEQVRESEAKFHAIFEQAGLGIAVVDSDGTFLDVNNAVAEMFGFTPDEMLGESIRSVTVEADIELSMTQFNALLNKEQAIAQFEKRYLRKGGAPFEAKLISTAVFDQNGEFKFTVALVEDITERNKAERALRESEERLRAIADASPSAIFLKDTDGRYIFANRVWHDQYNPASADITGGTVHDILPADVSDSAADVDAKVLETGAPITHEQKLPLPGGGWQYVLSTKFPVRDGDGNIVGIGGVNTDITDRVAVEEALRQSEEWFRALVDYLPAGVTLKDHDQNIIFVNGQVAERYGVSSPEDFVGKKFHEVISSQTEAISSQQIADFAQAQQVVLDGGEPVEMDISAVFADGTRHDLQTIFFPVKAADGESINVGTVTFDITDRKRTEEMLVQAQKMQAVGQLTGGVAHDFNNLLAVVIGNLDMLAEKFPKDAPDFDHVRNAINAAERGASLTQQLLAFARQQVLQPEETDIANLLFETKELMSVSMGEKIALEVNTAGDLWRCKVDQAQLQNAILNLSLNARDAMPSGGRLTISAENAPIDADRAEVLELDGGDYICLSVIDTGCGIPEDLLEHVYEPFFTTKDVGAGSGLGLSMVHGFARQSGGGIDIETGEDEGTTVRLYFPAIVQDGADATKINTKSEDELNAPDATIVLVEDNVDFREITRTILESLNFRVFDFGTAEAALTRIADATPVDLLMSDIGLPGRMNGHDLAGYAASVRPGIKVVLMSAHADQALNGDIIDRNVSAFLGKPHRKAELTQTICRVLGLNT